MYHHDVWRPAARIETKGKSKGNTS
ncbi:hypothetical protein BRADO6701 [Bradyrhizobium sp. ORS 278]|nr:hypothetical protein BRADO6701 [Bradyrhizobium sp. ORS 278]